MNHREMTQTQAVKAIHRQRHVCGIERMNQVSDDAVHLLAPVDFPCRIVFIDNDGAVGRGEADFLRFAHLMNHRETRR